MLAVGLLKRGFDVKVFEKNITAIRGEGKYRGPIQVGSSDSLLAHNSLLTKLQNLRQALHSSAGAKQCLSCS